MKALYVFALLFTLIGFIFFIFLVWSSKGALIGLKPRYQVRYYHFAKNNQTQEANKRDLTHRTLKICTWNTSYFYGLGSEGDDQYVKKDKQYFEERMQKSLTFFQDCDLLFLQEIDFDAQRSHHIDQVKYLSQKLEMNAIYLSSWDLNYLPFPYELHRQWGKINSGGAVLSRFPLDLVESGQFEKPKNMAWPKSVFYLDRYWMTLDVKISSDLNLRVCNTHLEAFDENTRLHQLTALKHKCDVDLLAGDFNMELNDMAISRDQYQVFQVPSYPNPNPTQILDAILVHSSKNTFKMSECSSLDVGGISDHHALVCFLSVGPKE